VITTVSLRPATPDDCRRVWDWRNDASTRAVAFNADVIPYEQHRRWFETRLTDPDLLFLIIVDGTGEPVGYVRCAVHEGAGEVSIALAPQCRGRGYGTEALREAAARFFAEWPLQRLTARVLSTNVASLRAFEHAGFVERGVTAVDGQPTHELVLERSA
jgi:RimJ/RimL family protein N-acetyltransferase